MSSMSWKYLGLAMAPTMVLALPKGDDMFGWELEKRYMPGTEGDELAKDESDSDKEEATPSPSTSTTPTATPTPTELANTAVTTLPVAHQTHAEETREHWMIAVGSVVAFIVICAICFALWKWRAVVVAKFSRRRGQNDPEKGAALAGRWFKKSAKAPKSERRSLFGTATTVTGAGDHAGYQIPNFPPPALAPSTIGRLDMQARRQQVRRTLLAESEKQRVPASARSQTFFIDDEHHDESPAPRKTKRENLSLTIDVFGNATFVAPAVPDSPEAAKTNTRYSWVTPPQDAQTPRSLPRSSMDSAPRFRTVDSWVRQQADRAARAGGNGFDRRGSITTPPTPVEFRQHPGSPAEFLSDSPRIESRVLDLRMEARS
ncbi:hypothetical protein K440DRAFT_664206 [Wilcoxina mikolae CBS 423.85]|nr:hypothetical protein K440DRAFT_664206 [Wilcoxina mikolae CBS 423.85]